MNSNNQIKDHWREQRLFSRRIIACSVIAVLLTGTVFTRLAILQLVNAEYYAAQSQGNRIRVQPLPPTRGLIFDRNQNILAENTPSYQLEITPEQVPDLDDTLARLEANGLIKTDSVNQIIDLINSKRRFDSIPIRQRMSDEEVARFAVLRPYFPGVEIRARLARHYPYGKVASHAIGYVSGISPADQEILDPALYAGTSYIGKVAAERSFEAELHGTPGHQDVLVNVHGRMMQVLNTELAIPGQDLILSLDMPSQLTAETELAGRRGAVVAIDPSNGEVLVFASNPGFDPNGFIRGLTRAEFRSLQNDVDQPLFNRALRGAYPPGSTIKPLLALAGLEQQVIQPGQQIICRGFYTLPGHSHRYRDWKPGGHGLIDMHGAIVQSCDTYFYGMANELGIDAISDALKGFGLGAATDIDIGPENKGLVPSREWKRRNFSAPEDQVWFPGETVITGIGQGYLLATPLQLAHVTATIAARGKRYRPSLVQGIRDPITGTIARRQPKELPPLQVSSPKRWEQIIDAMRGVISDPKGTARAVGANAPWPIAGKSGTAQVFTVAQDETYNKEDLAERMRDHALFIAFAPADKPRIAVAVIVENGGSGSGVAGPLARKVMDTFLGSAAL
jgi:penicillin-binding protein 2